MSKSLGKAPPELTAAIRKKCGERGHTFEAREVAGETMGVCIKCGQIADVKESADAKLVDAQFVVFELQQKIVRLEEAHDRMVTELRAVLNMTPRGADWN